MTKKDYIEKTEEFLRNNAPEYLENASRPLSTFHLLKYWLMNRFFQLDSDLIPMPDLQDMANLFITIRTSCPIISLYLDEKDDTRVVAKKMELIVNALKTGLDD